MTLKKKMASILLFIMVISTLVYFAVFKLIVFKSFVEAENSDAIHDMHQCISVLKLEIKHLNRFVHDWSSWDDAYKFATDRHQEFIKENLELTEYRNQSLTLIHFYDRDGRLVWGKTYDLKTEKEIPLNLAKELNATLFHKLVTQENPDRFTSGIIQTSIGPMIIAARPILSSDDKGPSHGALIMGRLFTQESLTDLSEQVGVDLMAWPVRDERMPKAIKDLIPLLSDLDSVRLTYVSSDILHAYSIVKDINNQPAIMLGASFSRNITHKGMKAYVVGMMFILGAGLLVFVSISVMLGTYILKPIANLTENALAIGVSTKNLRGFETSRGDEIGVLSREFAAMLERLSKSEETIRKSEERYRTIFESTATANIIVAKDTTILLANTDFANITGYSKQELEGKVSWTGFIVKKDLEMMKRYHRMRELTPGSAPTSYEIHMINRKGEVRNLFISVADIPETKESVASMIDITEWKRSEQARNESEERFQELAGLLPETVYEADRNGIFTFINKTGFEKFGYVQEDLSSKMSVVDMIIPQDHIRLIATYERIIQGERVGLGEYTARKKDGSTFPALVHATAIYSDGKPVGHRGFIIDISEKKNLENQLTRAQKMEAIGTLAGGIAHDFNNLLMGILGNISLILLKFDQTHPIYDRLKSMEGYVQRGSDLTKQLLGFARGGKYEVKPTDLGELIRESSELFGRTKKEIRIHHKAQEGLWAVEVDRGQIEQVLLNLYVNAWQAMPHGGPLYLSAENVELDNVEVNPYEINPGNFVKVTVTDTGIGMDEVTKTKIFEPFFTTKERGRGTGLGLASSYGIIKNHGGFIDVESEKDIGTSFIIYLPASEKDVDFDKKPVDELLKGRETVLLIDDEEMILDVSAKMLEELGYQVISAAGGRKGIHTYEQNKDRVDLVILDMIMPEFGGRESFDTMIRINPSVRVLLSSGYSLDSQAKEIMQRGCKGFIQKPFTMTALSKKIREILDKQLV